MQDKLTKRGHKVYQLRKGTLKKEREHKCTINGESKRCYVDVVEHEREIWTIIRSLGS